MQLLNRILHYSTIILHAPVVHHSIIADKLLSFCSILRLFRCYFVVCCHEKVENDDDMDFVVELYADVGRHMIE